MFAFNKNYEKNLIAAWEHFTRGERFDAATVRPVVLNSWKRSKDYGVDPFSPAPASCLKGAQLKVLLEENSPLIDTAHKHLLNVTDILKSTGFYILLCDKEGYILDLICDEEVLSRYEKDPSLAIGANRSERSVGTNAAGTSLAIQAPIQLWGEEHFIKSHKPFACTGSPIRGKYNEIIGCLSIIGSRDSIQPHTMGIIVSAVDSIERDLKSKNFKATTTFKPQYTFNDIIGESRGVVQLKEIAKRISPSNSSVLIWGESGTGKEVFAQAIHNASNRKYEPFIAINCGAIPTELIESELFGYVDGAFTGASRGGRMGKLEAASGGTLFLDEIESMPLAVQVKLLRVLSARTITRIGSNTELPIDLRIISATKSDLLQEVEAGRFREDFYFRINIITLKIPPLRQRGRDILLLADHYIDRLQSELNIKPCDVTDDFYEALLHYHWRGNVRELKNVLERALVVNNGDCPLTASFLPELTGDNSKSACDEGFWVGEAELSLQEIERLAIKQALLQNHGNMSLTAKKLNISRSTLYLKIKNDETLSQFVQCDLKSDSLL